MATPIEWPVLFQVEDGRRFRVTRVAGSEDSLVARVDGSAGDRTVGAYLGEQTAGAVIGRTLRWWYETTRDPVVLAKPSPDDGG